MDAGPEHNIEELQKVFHTRMEEYEERLRRVAESSPSRPDVGTLASEFSEFKLFVNKSLDETRLQLDSLHLSVDRLETSARRKILLVHGVPEQSNESVKETVLRVFSDRMKLDSISSAHIAICHRLGSSQGKNRAILVRFTELDYRHLVWDNKTTLKGTGITVSEFLTKARHNAFSTARRHFGIKNCWTVEGRIVILLPDKSRRKLESLSEVQKLIADHPIDEVSGGPGGSVVGVTEVTKASTTKAGTSNAPKASAAKPLSGKQAPASASGRLRRRV